MINEASRANVNALKMHLIPSHLCVPVWVFQTPIESMIQLCVTYLDYDSCRLFNSSRDGHWATRNVSSVNFSEMCKFTPFASCIGANFHRINKYVDIRSTKRFGIFTLRIYKEFECRMCNDIAAYTSNERIAFQFSTQREIKRCVNNKLRLMKNKSCTVRNWKWADSYIQLQLIAALIMELAMNWL